MRYRPLLQVALLALAVALGTFMFGWWMVPLIGAVWGLVARERERPQLIVALAAAVGWALLILWTSTQGPIGEVARRAAGVMGMSRPWFLLITVAFPMIVAWAAAVITGAVRGKET
jgi:ribose/xylose/arabinose/galactoside ABC-type transport system permease subunit